MSHKPGNVWTDIPATNASSVDMNELEDTFSMDQAGAEGSRATQPSRRQSVTTVLDITRANNVGERKHVYLQYELLS